jgi:serralysin
MPLSHSRMQIASARLFAQETGLAANGLAFDLMPSDGFFKLTAAKATTAILQDGLGDIHPSAPAALIVTSDNVPDSIGGNPTLTVDAPSIISTIDTIGDQDFYQVTLVAGHSYEIGMYGHAGGPNAVPLQDSYIELYDSAGNLVVSADGGANTPANSVNSGFDALLSFDAEVSGTYYVNARAFDQDGTNGTTGDGLGDYEIFVNEVDPNDPTIYHPYYDVNSPLYAIDWGTRVNKINQSAANPDGDEGPRPTGNAQGTPVYSSALDIPALAAAQGVDITGKNVVTVYFAKAGDVFTSIEDPTNPGLPPVTITATGVQGFEHLAVMTALGEFSKVADVVYLEVQDRNQADFIYTSYQGTPGPGVSLLGSMEPPDEPNEGLAAFNSGDERWNATDLTQGGFSFTTLIHEFGHGHGLAHPHDNGGHSGIMHGVQPDGPVASYTLGDFDLNQGVFTMMSYEDGWQTSPYGNAPTTGGYGYLGSLMAFDIAAIQDKYGVNEDWATGDDVYMLQDVNAIGTYYRSIWDAGGNDEIKYVGTKDANIDLRPATLQYEFGGGGWVSYAFGIFGGYTIANGVTIEKATTDAGNDTIHDNAANNILSSGAGNDFVYASMGGDDTVDLGTGNDAVYFGAMLSGLDSVEGGDGKDVVAIQGDYSGGLTLGAGALVDVETLSILTHGDARFGGDSAGLDSYVITTVDANVAAGHQLTVNASTLEAEENLTFDGSAETDGSFFIYGGKGDDHLTGGAGVDVFFFAEQGRFGSGDQVDGGAGNDILVLRGDYTIDMATSAIVNIETVTLMSGADARFVATTSNFNYDITTADNTVAAGATMTFNGGGLRATETLTFDGSAETNGNFRIFGGAGTDDITGGAGNDLIYGGLGADTLRGGDGNDVFRYQSAAESTASGRDGIQDFATGDIIDLSRIDGDVAAGKQSFHFVGGGAFTHEAGELIATNGGSGNIWTISGDTDGDGNADFQLLVVSADNHAIGAGDFVL